MRDQGSPTDYGKPSFRKSEIRVYGNRLAVT